MAFFNRIRESVSAVEKRVDDHFARMKELRDEKSLYGLGIHIRRIPSDSRRGLVQVDPEIAALNKGKPLFHKTDANGNTVAVFHTDIGHESSGKIFPYVTAVREPETLSSGELTALLAHPKVQKSAPRFRIEQWKALLEKKNAESANSKK